MLPALLGALFIVVPVAVVVSRVPLLPGPDGTGGLWDLVTSPAAGAALGLSLRTSLTATVCCVLVGTPMALVLARTSFPGQRLARSLVLLPLVLPPVVGGLALLYTFGRRGLIGARLEVLGIEVAFSTTAVIMAQTFVALPFLVLTLEGALRTLDTRLEEVAATLGARPATIVRRVTLPQVLPGLASGAVLAFARALGEFGATITFAGALQGVTQTLPLEIYLQRSADPDTAVALSMVLIVVAIVITATVHGAGMGTRASRRRRGEPRRGDEIAAAGVETVPPGPAAGAEAFSGPAPVAQVGLDVTAKVSSRGLMLSLQVDPGQVVAIIGPNGAGKSSALLAVAGLLGVDPRQGDRLEVRVDGDVLTDIGGERTVLVPPQRRHVGWVSQRSLLFEHLTVLENIAFGPRARRAGRAAARYQASAMLAGTTLSGLGDRRGNELSGGQAQRVAIARALVTNPTVLLLDEPFAALDVDIAQQVRSAVLQAQRAAPRTTLLVTHDLLDVLLLADRVVVVEDGRIVEDSPVDAVLSRPRSAFAARLAGVNLVSGRITAVDPVPGAGDVQLHLDGPGVELQGIGGESLALGTSAVAVFDPRAVTILRERPAGTRVSTRNAARVRVSAIEPHGSFLRVWASPAALDSSVDETPLMLSADVTAAAVAELQLGIGQHVWFAVKAVEVRVHAR